ncbi:uncharacterized protein LOC117121131 [Anneissia japonica]|uniref:uncharacterized protein LOC117121131 n=1 Tax=Anneissia japonica TaxID=1529436 RepID=UPI001425B38D|nr:uncharacterized protein LOC117121131 [Anneissia japonica]
MTEQNETPLSSSATLKDELVSSMSSMVTDMKNDIMRNVKDLLYAREEIRSDDDDHTDLEDEFPAAQAVQNIDDYAKEREQIPEVDQHSGFSDLPAEFSTADPTGPAVDVKLTAIVSDLIGGKLPKKKLAELVTKYPRPQNCESLVTPRINLPIWGQMKPGSKAVDVGLQKAQTLFMSSMYALLRACQESSGEMRTILTHSLVLSLAANRELNLKRREMLKPDLNTRFAALCGPSTPITKDLFGDISKQIDDLSKANRVGERVATSRRARVRSYQPYSGARRYGSRQGSQFKSNYRGFLGGRGSQLRTTRGRAAAPQVKRSRD